MQAVQSRSAKRSRRGCPECRRRKIKCDERRPRCGQCQKKDRHCQPLDSVFKPYTRPSRQSVRDNEEQPHREGVVDLAGLSVGSSVQTDKSQPVDVNDGVSVDFYRVTQRPSEISGTFHQETRQIPQDIIDEVHDQVPLEAPPSEEFVNINIRTAPSSPIVQRPIVSRGTTQEFLTDNDHSIGIDTGASPVGTTNSVAASSSIGIFIDTQEELFLLRHYSECIAPWMDLLYRYEVFSREVLTLAREHPILRYAACAVAAKQLGQMRSPLSSLLRGKTQERIATNLATGRYGFLWYGAKYYEKAIQTLVKSIAPRDPQSGRPIRNHPSPAVSLSGGDLMVRAEGEDPIVRLLGTCILIQYEHLSANRDAWSGHLTGFSKLLCLIDDGNLLQPNEMFEQVYPFTKDIMEVKAGFWNFVVNDLEESFVSNRRTRIDTENLALWRNMGLLVEDDGTLDMSLGSHSLTTTPEHARDKVLSYTLIRLLCVLICYLAPPAAPVSNLEFLLHPEASSTNRKKGDFIFIENQFNAWFRILSPSFHPDGTFLTSQETEQRHAGKFDREVWFSNDLCSTTMMYYHMACMLLLIHRPTDLLSGADANRTGVSFDLLRMFRDVEQRLQFHASEVISIVQGTPCDAVKLRAIQPLYVAGRCCTDTGDRRRLVGMLRDIQDKMGIATEYRIKTLLQEWGITYDTLGIESRSSGDEHSA